MIFLLVFSAYNRHRDTVFNFSLPLCRSQSHRRWGCRQPVAQPAYLRNLVGEAWDPRHVCDRDRFCIAYSVIRQTRL